MTLVRLSSTGTGGCLLASTCTPASYNTKIQHIYCPDMLGRYCVVWSNFTVGYCLFKHASMRVVIFDPFTLSLSYI